MRGSDEEASHSGSGSSASLSNKLMGFAVEATTCCCFKAMFLESKLKALVALAFLQQSRVYLLNNQLVFVFPNERCLQSFANFSLAINHHDTDLLIFLHFFTLRKLFSITFVFSEERCL